MQTLLELITERKKSSSYGERREEEMRAAQNGKEPTIIVYDCRLSGKRIYRLAKTETVRSSIKARVGCADRICFDFLNQCLFMEEWRIEKVIMLHFR